MISPAIPRHVAIIMDGNGRWAKERGLPRIKGHEQGAEAVRACVEGCGDLRIEYLTLYAFSAENWQRPKTEVAALMPELAGRTPRALTISMSSGTVSSPSDIVVCA